MELNFKQNEQLNYEVEFKVEDVFNIHIEKSNKGPILILQKSTPNGNYAKTSDHIYSINALTSIEDINSYDFTVGYPEKLIFKC